MLAIEKVILLIIFLIVLIIAFIVLFGIGKGSADTLLLQNEIRQCCGLFRAYNCADPTTVKCNDNSIGYLMIKLGMTPPQLKEFCNCPTT